MNSSRTLSEIASTCAKAARGAGCPWGMAEEAGLAARRLCAYGLPGAEAMAALLSSPRSCACTGDNDAPACGLAEMVALLDAPPAVGVELGDIASPLLVLAFALTEGGHWELRWTGGSAICGPSGVEISGELPGSIAPMTLSRVDRGSTTLRADWTSRDVDKDAWEILENLAARLLVPETAQSRASGAGPDT